mmetsp:Transcript_29273/g.51390  ORF Transcript_29273/g.51390 Transcript_29273/m.51390 type:complete len:335 (+) Transcript_29273:128-1132(+)
MSVPVRDLCLEFRDAPFDVSEREIQRVVGLFLRCNCEDKNDDWHRFSRPKIKRINNYTSLQSEVYLFATLGRCKHTVAAKRTLGMLYGIVGDWPTWTKFKARIFKQMKEADSEEEQKKILKAFGPVRLDELYDPTDHMYQFRSEKGWQTLNLGEKILGRTGIDPEDPNVEKDLERVFRKSGFLDLKSDSEAQQEIEITPNKDDGKIDVQKLLKDDSSTESRDDKDLFENQKQQPKQQDGRKLVDGLENAGEAGYNSYGLPRDTEEDGRNMYEELKGERVDMYNRDGRIVKKARKLVPDQDELESYIPSKFRDAFRNDDGQLASALRNAGVGPAR